MYDTAWMADKNAAITFSSWWKVQHVAQQAIDKKYYDAYKNCVEKDSVK